MSPYSRYRPLPGSDGITVLQTPPGCRPTGPTACRFLRWIAKLTPQTVNNKGIGKLYTKHFQLEYGVPHDSRIGPALFIVILLITVSADIYHFI